ncbi:MAG: CDGSH iron-sulfur domain-containing protein [Maribacter stanieri]
MVVPVSRQKKYFLPTLKAYKNEQTKWKKLHLKTNALKIHCSKQRSLKIKGNLQIQLASGEIVTKEGTTGFCRCGVSDNKPFCDGSHRKIEFTG